MTVKKRSKAPIKAVKVAVNRKNKYEEWLTAENLVRIKGWAMDGLTRADIAENMDISDETLNQWCKKYIPIAEALKNTREYADRHVENALFKSATGYDYEEDVVTKTGEVVKVTKHMPANTTAQIFWLKNRKRDVWRDKIEAEITGKDGGAIQIQALTEEDIDKRIAQLKQIVTINTTAVDTTAISDDNSSK